MNHNIKRKKVIKHLSEEKYLLPSLTLFSATFFLVKTSMDQGLSNFYTEAATFMFAVAISIFGPLSYVLFFRNVDFDKKTFNIEYYKIAYLIIMVGYISVASGLLLLVLSTSFLAAWVALIIYVFIMFTSTEVVQDK